MHFEHSDGTERVVQGRPGQNLLEIALYHDIELDHACGGVCACSTCHVKIMEGADLLTEARDDEEDQLDDARDLSLESRLACQAKILPGANGKIRVAIPAWNVNAVREGH
ncbi:MAG: 2Fe-2S iron-sulfur cluster binding domain-containing protein [Planctomycetes bacterium]|nr:2Fe-2S iron-sulfur cluster binding domain-containing protein [Planctomycetota bacterium]